jgi:hypothetical protein
VNDVRGRMSSFHMRRKGKKERKERETETTIPEDSKHEVGE